MIERAKPVYGWAVEVREGWVPWGRWLQLLNKARRLRREAIEAWQDGKYDAAAWDEARRAGIVRCVRVVLMEVEHG